MNTPGPDWQRVGPAAALDVEDVMPFEINGHEYAIYHTIDGFFASDGMCTHEEEPLADGIVIDNVIECPLHQSSARCTRGASTCAAVKPSAPRFVSTCKLLRCKSTPAISTSRYPINCQPIEALQAIDGEQLTGDSLGKYRGR
jgi:3-phenylpropionate/trans-cinnamate dioxygenase ferredoxin subunit